MYEPLAEISATCTEVIGERSFGGQERVTFQQLYTDHKFSVMLRGGHGIQVGGAYTLPVILAECEEPTRPAGP